jgi:hypothetical protein
MILNEINKFKIIHLLHIDNIDEQKEQQLFCCSFIFIKKL